MVEGVLRLILYVGVFLPYISFTRLKKKFYNWLGVSSFWRV